MYLLFVVIRFLLRHLFPDQRLQPVLLRTGRRARREREEAELQRVYAREIEQAKTDSEEAIAALWRRCWGVAAAFLAVLQPEFWKRKGRGKDRPTDL